MFREALLAFLHFQDHGLESRRPLRGPDVRIREKHELPGRSDVKKRGFSALARGQKQEDIG